MQGFECNFSKLVLALFDVAEGGMEHVAELSWLEFATDGVDELAHETKCLNRSQLSLEALSLLSGEARELLQEFFI